MSATKPGVFGPTATPASRYPTIGESPARCVRYPKTSAPARPPVSVRIRSTECISHHGTHGSGQYHTPMTNRGSAARVAQVSLWLALGVTFASSASAAPSLTSLTSLTSLKGRAVWAQPADAGTTEASVRAFVEQLDRAHINTVVMEVKTAAGLFWPSERFAEAVVPAYREFDFPAVLIREAHA